jgi:hypothetical protein
MRVLRPAGTPNLIVKPDFGSLVQIPNVGDPENVFFIAWDRTLGLYRIMSFDDLFAGVADLGFMEESVYDPQGKSADAFDRANHTGTQAISTVSGLQPALDTLTNGKLALAGGTMSGDIDMGSNDIRKVSTLNDGPLAGYRDAIINGDGVVNQRTYTTVADDIYWCDRHYVLTQTATVTPTILADVANGLPNMMRLSQSQATAQRMGNAQIVEARDSKRFRGKQVTLGGHLRCSSSQAIRYAILEWTGTADTVTSDVVNNWTNGTFTAGQFFLGASLTVAAVGTITPAANTVTPWSLTANISGSCNNLIVFMWTEGTAAQNVTLDMVWGLVQGDATAETWPYAPRSMQQELALCQRRFWTGFAQAGGTNLSATGSLSQVWVSFPVTMAGTPSLSNTNQTLNNTTSLTVDNAQPGGCRMLAQSTTANPANYSGSATVIAEKEL